jgi:hypothetical protein
VLVVHMDRSDDSRLDFAEEKARGSYEKEQGFSHRKESRFDVWGQMGSSSSCRCCHRWLVSWSRFCWMITRPTLDLAVA